MGKGGHLQHQKPSAYRDGDLKVGGFIPLFNLGQKAKILAFFCVQARRNYIHLVSYCLYVHLCVCFTSFEMTLVVSEMAEIWPMGFRMVYCFCVPLLSEMFYLIAPFKTEERMMYRPCSLHQQGIEALFLRS